MYGNILFVFQGLVLAGFKNPAISPLFITMTGVMIFACAYCIRSLTRNSDVSWQKEETPQNRTMGQQFNMLSRYSILWGFLFLPADIRITG